MRGGTINRELTFKCTAISIYLPLIIRLLNAMGTLIDSIIANEDVTFHIASFLCNKRAPPSTLTEFYSNECLVSKVRRGLFVMILLRFHTVQLTRPPLHIQAMEQCIWPCKSTATLGLSPKTAQARRSQRLVVSQAHLYPKRLGSTRWWG